MQLLFAVVILLHVGIICSTSTNSRNLEEEIRIYQNSLDVSLCLEEDLTVKFRSLITHNIETTVCSFDSGSYKGIDECVVTSTNDVIEKLRELRSKLLKDYINHSNVSSSPHFHSSNDTISRNRINIPSSLVTLTPIIQIALEKIQRLLVSEIILPHMSRIETMLLESFQTECESLGYPSDGSEGEMQEVLAEDVDAMFSKYISKHNRYMLSLLSGNATYPFLYTVHYVFQ
jgi:hypothetical protein